MNNLDSLLYTKGSKLNIFFNKVELINQCREKLKSDFYNILNNNIKIANIRDNTVVLIVNNPLERLRVMNLKEKILNALKGIDMNLRDIEIIIRI